MSSGYLHLTFEPEATWGQIGTLAHDLAALDEFNAKDPATPAPTASEPS